MGNFLIGVVVGFIILLVNGWIIDKFGKKDEPKPYPLNRELIEFWEKSLKQKDEELRLLYDITNIISSLRS